MSWSVLFIVYLFIERGHSFHGWVLTSEYGCPLATQGNGNGNGHGQTRNEYSGLSSAECPKTCMKDVNCYAFKYSGDCHIWDLSKKSECQVDARGSEKILIKSTQCKIFCIKLCFYPYI